MQTRRTWWGFTGPRVDDILKSSTFSTCTQGALTCIGGPAPTPGEPVREPVNSGRISKELSGLMPTPSEQSRADDQFHYCGIVCVCALELQNMGDAVWTLCTHNYENIQ